MVAPRALTAVALAIALTASVPSARADDRAEAAAAYDRATAAFEAGRFREAADEFRRADDRAPSAAALEGAITAAVRADDPALVMSLVERAERRRGDPRLDAVAADARARFAGRVAPAPPPATPQPAEPVPAGPDGGATGPAPSTSATVAPTAPPAPPAPRTTPATSPGGDAPPGTDGSGPAPAWFFVGLGATALLGGAAIATGVATLSHHDDFEAAPSDDGRDTGLLLQNTTNGLLVGAAAAGVVTIVLAAVVDWSGASPPAHAGRRGLAVTF